MTSEMRNPVLVRHGARGFDQLAGRIDREDTLHLADVQASYLAARFGLSHARAGVVASLAFERRPCR